MESALSTSKFANIDKLRGFAALSVLVYHVIEHTHWNDFPAQGFNFWWRIGWMGVDLFFVISGFVIFLSANALYDKYGENWRRVYSVHRLARIAPLYFLTLAIFWCLISPELLLLPWKDLLFQLITHALFIHNLFPSTQGAINGVNWSIGVEMQFYVFVLLAFNWLRRASPGMVLFVLCGVASLWKFGLFLLFPDATVAQRWFMTIQLPGTLDEFGFGIAACKLMMSHRRELPALINPWQRLGLMILGVSMMLFLFLQVGQYWDSLWVVTFFRIIMGLAGALLILAATAYPERVPFHLLRPLDYLGEISYGIYLWHLPVILSLQRLNLPAGSQFLTLTIIVTILLAALSYHLLERPWLMKGRTYAPVLDKESSILNVLHRSP